MANLPTLDIATLLQDLILNPGMQANISDTVSNITSQLNVLSLVLPSVGSITSTNGTVSVGVSALSADQGVLDKITGGFAISDIAQNITNALGAITADSNIVSVTGTGGNIDVDVAVFQANQAGLDKITAGFYVADTAAHISANLDHLNDPTLLAITVTDNAAVGADVAQLTTDQAAIGKLSNANGTPGQLAISDTAAGIVAGLDTLTQDTALIATITSTSGAVAVNVAAFSDDRAALDKIVGGFSIADTAGNIAAAIGALAADSHITALSVTGGGPVVVSAASASANAAALDMLPGGYSVADTAANISQVLDGLGDPELTAIRVTDNAPVVTTAAQVTRDAAAIGKLSDASTTPATITVTDTAANVVAQEPAIQAQPKVGAIVLTGGSGTDAGSFALASAASLDIGSSTLALNGATSLLSSSSATPLVTGASGSLLALGGATSVGNLVLGGSLNLRNAGMLTQSGSIQLGDASANHAAVNNTTAGTIDITGDGGIGRGSSTASYILNAGLLEKTGGAGTSTIVPNITNSGTILVSSGLLDLRGAVSNTGAETISGASTLEFEGVVAQGQTVTFAGSGGTLLLTNPQSFLGSVTNFGASDTIDLRGLQFAAGATASLSNGVLTLTSNGTTDHVSQFSLASGLAANTQLHLSSDGSGGSALTLLGVTFSAMSVGTGGQLTFSGTVTQGSGASVSVYNGATLIGVAAVNSIGGTWTLSVTPPAGTYATPTAVATNPAGVSVGAVPPFNFVAGVTGQPYATIENVRDGTGVFNTQMYFNADGSLYTLQQNSTTSAGLKLRSFSGGSYFTGKPYTSYANTYDSANNLVATAYSGVTGQPYTSYQNDYDNMHHLADQKQFGFTGQPYTSAMVTFGASGDVSAITQYAGTSVYLAEHVSQISGGVTASTVYAGSVLAGKPYSSFEADTKNGQLLEKKFFDVQNQPYSSFNYFYDAAQNIASQTTNFNNGTHALKGFQDGTTLTSVGNDTMTGGGSSETFLFNTGYGHETVTDLYQHFSGAGHDTVSVAKSEFADMATLLAHTQTSGSNSVITGASGDTITLLGLSKTALASNPGDFVFHA